MAETDKVRVSSLEQSARIADTRMDPKMILSGSFLIGICGVIGSAFIINGSRLMVDTLCWGIGIGSGVAAGVFLSSLPVLINLKVKGVKQFVKETGSAIRHNIRKAASSAREKVRDK